jgi:small subunit ribosomal protein S1
VTDVLSWLAHFGAWGLLIIAVILFAIFYEKLEKPIAQIQGLFYWAGASWRRRTIKGEIQSEVNSFSQSMEKEVPNTMPYKMKLQFVSDIDKTELLRDKSLVLVRIRDRRHDDKNFVHTMLAFCPVGVLPASRPYLDDSLGDAIDFTVTRKFLNTLQYQGALNYLYKDVIEPETTRNPELDKLCTILDRLDEQGLFTKVVLRELRDFGAKVGSRYPTQAHKAETRKFVTYMNSIAARAPGEVCNTDFQGNCVSMGFMFIGTSPKIEAEGAVTYLRAIQWKKSMGLERIYIAARDWAVDLAERTSYLAERRKLAKTLKRRRYYATDSLGQRREHILIEMQPIIMTTSVALPEQGILLEE